MKITRTEFGLSIEHGATYAELDCRTHVLTGTGEATIWELAWPLVVARANKSLDWHDWGHLLCAKCDAVLVFHSRLGTCTKRIR